MKRNERKHERIRRIVAYLHWHGHKNIAEISRDLCIPKSTVFDYMKEIEQEYAFVMVRKYAHSA